MTDISLEDGFRKVTGPIEHWVTTLYHGYWGFRQDKKEAWKEIKVGEVFLFHASKSALQTTPKKKVADVGGGVIGIGVVGAKSRKEEPTWWGELHNDEMYPYLIHFSEIQWFGDASSIRDAPVKDKDLDEMIRDVHLLNKRIITFAEMDKRAGYRIPAQGSPGNVKHPRKLFPLLLERIEGRPIQNQELPEQSETQDRSLSEFQDDDSVLTSSGEIRDRNRDRNLNEDVEEQAVTYRTNIGRVIGGTLEHEATLDIFEDYLSARGFEGGETDRSDLLMANDTDVILCEAKSIRAYNERAQIRKALGQLLEYSYFDVRNNANWDTKTLSRCLLLSRRPSDHILTFLEGLIEDQILTFWKEEDAIRGTEESLTQLKELVE
ncbi:hypothetical protein [Haladaptatus sp. DJG-WS-42]|uniref:hypothetical protein n=1 Tax=Haladaptatus sp. DJG-WS-42 TaxID=3120516 RepID=UPI0030D12ECD